MPELMQRFGCSQRNSLRMVQMSTSTYLYTSVAPDATLLKMRIKEISDTRVHYGYRRVHVILRRDGHPDNVKHVCRPYREEGLLLPPPRRAHKRQSPRVGPCDANGRPDEGPQGGRASTALLTAPHDDERCQRQTSQRHGARQGHRRRDGNAGDDELRRIRVARNGG